MSPDQPAGNPAIELLTIVGLILLTPVLALWNGYVLVHLWAWFMVPIFHVPTLALAHAIGLSFVVSFVTSRYRAPIDDKHRRDRLLYWFIYPAVSLLYGWVVHQFI